MTASSSGAAPQACSLWACPGVELVVGGVVSGTRLDTGGFALELADGRRETTRCVLLAAGVEYRPPDLRGVAELWGTTVFHCPFCHDREFRDQPLAVPARGDKALRAGLLVRNWIRDLVLLTDGPADIDEAGRPLAAVVFEDGSRLSRAGLLVAATLRLRSKLAEQLGAQVPSPLLAEWAPEALRWSTRTSWPGGRGSHDPRKVRTSQSRVIANGNPR